MSVTLGVAAQHLIEELSKKLFMEWIRSKWTINNAVHVNEQALDSWTPYRNTVQSSKRDKSRVRPIAILLNLMIYRVVQISTLQ